MATTDTTNNQTKADRDLIERMVSALEQRAAEAPNNRAAADTPSQARTISSEATAAIASFIKTSNELAVLPPK